MFKTWWRKHSKHKTKGYMNLMITLKRKVHHWIFSSQHIVSYYHSYQIYPYSTLKKYNEGDKVEKSTWTKDKQWSWDQILIFVYVNYVWEKAWKVWIKFFCFSHIQPNMRLLDVLGICECGFEYPLFFL